jgi:mediator of DNA damage checkpoint protein 1
MVCFYVLTCLTYVLCSQVLTTTPTVRILKANENRYVVSCPADASIWRPLADSGYAVYSPELLLTGALRQEIDWDDDANKVPESF